MTACSLRLGDFSGSYVHVWQISTRTRLQTVLVGSAPVTVFLDPYRGRWRVLLGDEESPSSPDHHFHAHAIVDGKLQAAQTGPSFSRSLSRGLHVGKSKLVPLFDG